MDELDQNQIQMLKKAFDTFDREKKGVIGTDMIGTILEMLGQEIDDTTLSEIIKEYDQNDTGTLEFKEFCSLASRFMTEELDAEAMLAELREAFRLYDREGNGYITTDVLKEIFKELDNTLSNEELEAMITEIDADGSGTVDFDEFLEVMTGE
ncbi:troponin C, isoallergen Bla g 6.0101-like [Pararge aegeria]|uniref:Jg3258 protein n=1 Tax=Pararge aegeria aegeria TaxID=348720 RepID=A0A8S4RUU9_9NEOP|nr:troponin C, isoallergen Bla g 6.0101-like [Pararge aegeria]CAH2241193.1 jg3258 [Pararge aegeria aegeria]